MPNSKPTTVLAFDFGLRYIGVAVANSLTGQARGIATVIAKDGKPKWRDITPLVEEYAPDVLVIGNPLHMSGEASDMSALAQGFATQLAQRFGLDVNMQDERLTSRIAQETLADAQALGLGKTDHEVAACLIAEQYLAQISA